MISITNALPKISSGGGVKIVTWADGTDEEIVAMVQAADKGEINLADHWHVGDERIVHLSAMRDNWSTTNPTELRAAPEKAVLEGHVEQDVMMVLMHVGGKTLANATASGRTTCSFIVGLKNGLANGTDGEYGYINSVNTNAGGWDSCVRRKWCNEVFKNAVPESIRSIFKQHLNITADGSGSTTATSTDYFALPAEKEIFGTNVYADSTAETSLSQFTYYATSSNRIKTCGDSDSASASLWWERSPYPGDSSRFCLVRFDGSAGYNYARLTYLLAPFGCI